MRIEQVEYAYVIRKLEKPGIYFTRVNMLKSCLRGESFYIIVRQEASYIDKRARWIMWSLTGPDLFQMNPYVRTLRPADRNQEGEQVMY